MSSQRNLSIDVIKLAAAFGVVIVHLAPSTDAAEIFTRLFHCFAVPFFLMISLHFFINRVNMLPAFRLSDLRLDRILVPYAVWTVIYTLLRVLKFRLSGKSFPIDVIGSTLFGGAALQLYFLPLLLLFQALAFAVILLFRASNKWRLIGACVAFGAIVFGYIGSAGGYFGFNSALEKSVMYVALAFLLDRMQAEAIGRQINVIISWLIGVLIVYTTFFGYPPNALVDMIQGPIIGYGVSAFALNWRFHTTTPALRTLLTCSYGIYLAHFGFLESLEVAAEKLGYVLTPYSVAGKILIGSLICLCCVVFILIARLHWLSAYLFLGETANQARGYVKTNTIRPVSSQ
jgi:fucose 4-O-acetylase-like acetyltransferase